MAVVLLTDNSLYSIQHQAITTVLVAVVVMITMFILLGANFVQKKIGEYGITVISKVMGLILAAYYAIRNKHDKNATRNHLNVNINHLPGKRAAHSPCHSQTRRED